jgi:fumarate hydratase subunit beta
VNTFELQTPLQSQELTELSVGDKVLLSGEVYTARDAAHKRLVALIKEDQELPFELEGSAIYYVGPAPSRPGQVLNSAGPTTSYRMDPFTPMLLQHGMKASIGKGPRSREVRDAMVKHEAVYLGAVGGAAAGIASSVKEVSIIAYEDLGPEAVRRLVVKDMPLFVVNDTKGKDLFEIGVAEYSRGG